VIFKLEYSQLANLEIPAITFDDP